MDISCNVNTFNLFQFLFYWWRCKSYNSWSFTVRLAWVKLVVKEILHDKVIIMLLVSMMAFIKNNQIEFINCHETTLKDIIQLVFCEYEHIRVVKLPPPIFIKGFTSRILRRSSCRSISIVFTNFKATVLIDVICLLVCQVLCWNDECYLADLICFLLNQFFLL